MQYDNYEQKIQKIVKALRPIFRHIIKITISVALVVATTVTLLATRGIIIEASAQAFPTELIYGESLQYEAKAFLSNVEYEYSVANKEEWTKEFPQDPGKYKVRAVAKATFGYRYGTPISFTIKPRPITIKLLSGEVCYGEEPMAVAELLQGHTLSSVEFLYNGDKTAAEVNAQKVKILDENGTDITSRYVITSEQRGITFTARPVTITVENVAKVYDGLSLQSNSYAITTGSIANGDTLDISFAASITDVGTVENSPVYKMTNGNGADVTSLYAVTLNVGSLTVNKRAITVKTPALSVVYDGKLHEDHNYEITSELKIADGQTLQLSNWKSLTSVGEIANDADYKILNGQGVDVSSNYDISVEWGKLIVTPRPITIKTYGFTKVYDGYEHSDNRYEIIGEYGLAEGHFLHVLSWNSITNAGSVTNSIDYGIYNSEYEDETSNYTVLTDFGEFVLEKRKITVQTPTEEWEYDGKTRVYGEVTVDTTKGYDLCDNHVIKELDTKIYIDVRDSQLNNIPFVIECEYQDVTENYDITYEYGTITIRKRPITIETGSISEMYNGEYHRNANIWADTSSGKKGLVSGDTFEYWYLPEFKNVPRPEEGELKNKIDVQIYNYSRYVYVTDNYDIEMVYGSVTITPRPITITTQTATFTYDGMDHTFPEVTCTHTNGVGGICAGDNIVVEATSFRNVKESNSKNNKATFTIYDRYGEEITRNYAITTVWGTVTIAPRRIEIAIEGHEWVYNGRENTWGGFTLLDGTTLADGHTGVAKKSTMVFIVDVGKVANNFELAVFDAAQVDSTENYIITVRSRGILEVTKCSIKLSSGSDKKPYDGRPLTCHTIVAAKDSPNPLGEGNYIHTTFTFTGSQTQVGSSPNYFNQYSGKIVIYDKNEKDVTSFYEILSYTEGTLEVTEPSQNEENDDGSNGGGSAGKLDTSGNIQGGSVVSGGGGQPTVSFIVNSSVSGKIYLKYMSFGSYRFNGWNKAKEYDPLINDTASAYYLTPYALAMAGYSPAQIKIISKTGEYMIPYYSTTEACPEIQTGDVYIVGDASEPYYLNYIPYSWNSKLVPQVPEGLSKFEKEYEKFVRSQYLEIDAETKAYMDKLIKAHGWTSSLEDIARIEYYIQNAATYSLDYNKALDKSSNIVIAFLDEYKEGICQHYASAATMLYRALGIPARYTIGYVGQTVAGKDVEITSETAHAWVEVYISGLGWVTVDPTGSAEGGSGGNSGGEIPEGDPNKLTLIVKPAYQFKEYEAGKPLQAQNKLENNAVLDRLLESGYSYEVIVSGVQTEVGFGVSSVANFILYDKYGIDVTSQFNIVKQPGVLRVAKGFVKIYVYQKEYEYKDQKYSHGNDEYVVVENKFGTRIDISKINISLKNAGFITASEINENINKYINYKLYNSANKDVTDYYDLVVVDYGDSTDEDYFYDYKILTVEKRQLEIITASAEKEYNEKEPTPLTNNTFYIGKGLLLEGHTISLTVVGEQIEKGTSDNAIDRSSLRIEDSNGDDVSQNYDVKYNLGSLTVY